MSRLPVIAIITLLLGAMLLTEFYTHLAVGDFKSGIESVAQLDHAPGFWKAGLKLLGAHSGFFGPVAPLFLFFTAVFLILLVARKIFLWIATAIFLLYWVSLWVYPGVWIFEYLFPFAFAFCAACACTGQKLIGTQLFGKLPVTWRWIIVAASSILLWYVIYASKNAGEQTVQVAWQTSLSFAALFSISTCMDPLRKGAEKRTNWVNVMVLTIAAMMVLQVYADQAVGFYTVKGYAGLVTSYAKQSNTPELFRAFLSWTASKAAFFMPVQALFEAGIAIILSLLIFRGPALLLLTGMLALFTFSEFGVQAEMPGSPIFTFTHTWELLFATLASLFIGLKQTAEMVKAPNWRAKALGPKLFGSVELPWRFVIAIAAGLALFLAGIATHVFTTNYVRTSILGGVSFAILLGINAWLDDRRRVN
jgi:hypothetical protein